MEETFTAFEGSRRVAAGSRAELTERLIAAGYRPGAPLLVFSDLTGQETDLDLTGRQMPAVPRGRGRPKLGVRAKEITLLPRHWDWLARQRGGASATIRRLIDTAMKAPDTGARRDAAFRFCNAIAGDLPGFEEAMRALYAGKGFADAVAHWPRDIRAHAVRLAEPG
ncbi:DUF2239 family protein [Vannielia litorea]|uniref:DUF2239 family protein n=1 Tax=Vannielia litorea TaxID=1217970 RepID=A0A1N6G6Z6_9RHOB|nr:DUF2239 family protein [Vannielia litorea]SIO03283.1 hypothetical protein SAMN05444002_2252 [Vannielia litorea]